MRVALLVLLLPFAWACSAIIDPYGTPTRCSPPGAPGLCPAGMVCGPTGECVPGSGPDAGCGVELCNGGDDDCDTFVDETHDSDGDGYSWCGGGVMANADCEDGNNTVFPGAAERCDATDNDCDETVDEAASCVEPGFACMAGSCRDPGDCRLPGNECPSGEICDATRVPPVCVPSGCTTVPCTGVGEVCDEVRGVCVVPQPLGNACTSDFECESRVCASLGAVGISASGRVCTESCCDDQDCPPGTVCWSGGTGARLCVPPTALGAPSHGDGVAGAPCIDATDCRSLLCTMAGTCVSGCAHDGVCGADSCVAFGRGGTLIMACGAARGSGGLGDFCFEGCRSDLCNPETIMCTIACRTSADCGGGHCEAQSITVPVLASGWVQVCADGASGLGQGASCMSNPECVDRGCVDGRCASTCCNDAGCGGATRCRPVERGGHWEMRCTE